METKTLQQIKLSDIVVSSTNPRKYFNENELKELAKSIETHGVLQPIVLRTKGKEFELVAGERRFRASKIAKLTTIPAIVTAITDEEALEIQVIENLQRKDLSPMEEAEGYQALIKSQFKYTPESISAKIGKSTSYVKQRLQLMKLSKEGQAALREGEIQLGHALLICRIEDNDLQLRALKIVKDQGATVKELDAEIAKEILINLSSATFKLSDAELLPKMGACTTCPYNTSNNKDLFESVKGAGSCTKPKCFQEKVQIHFERSAEQEKEKGNIVIPIKEASKVFEKYNNRTWLRDEYVDPERPCFEHPKDLTYKQIFGGKVKEIIAIDGENKVRRVYKKTDVETIRKEMDWYKKKNQGSVDQTFKRQQRRTNIASALVKDALQKKVQSEASVTLACIILIIEAGPSLVEIAKEIDPTFKAESYQGEKAHPVILNYLKAMKSDEERIKYTLALIVANKNNYHVRPFLKGYFKIDEKKFAAAAKKQEAEEHAKSTARIKGKTAKKK